MNTTKLEQQLKATPAYLNPEGKAAIDDSLAKMHVASAAGKKDEVLRLQQELTAELERILATLLGSPLSPEDLKGWCETLLDDPEHGYDMAKDTVNIVLDTAKGEVCPTKEQVKASLFRTLTKEQIAELKKLREPTLLIVPDTTAERFQTAVDKPACKTIANQQHAVFDTFYTNALSAVAAQNKTKYRFVITEGRQHFNAQASDPDFAWNKREEINNKDRIAAFEEYLEAHPGIVSQNTAMYIMLMIRGLKGGKPIDRISDINWQFTLLPGEPKSVHVKDGLVAYGYWSEYDRRAHFGNACLEREDVYARLRAAVMGEIS